LGDYKADLQHWVDWQLTLVLTMRPLAELQRARTATFPDDLVQTGIKWLRCPIVDFGVPSGAGMSLWNRQSQLVNHILSDKGHTLAHCYDGSGPSGMMLMRLMCEVDESPDYALERLCAMLLFVFFTVEFWA